jgi:DNA-binding beta-propeller fold protein YncE
MTIRRFHSSFSPPVSVLASVLLGAPLLHGQQGTIAGPSAGFVFDTSSHVLRGIRGIPGASMIGDPVDFGFQPSWASVSPSLDSAVVADAQGALHLFLLNGGQPAEHPVDGIATAQHVVFSPSGTAAALYGAGSVQMLKGLPGAPVVAGTLSLGLDSSTQFAAASLGKTRRSTGEPLAVSDDGAYLLLVSGGGLRILGVAGDNRKLTDATAGTLAAFAPGGHDAVVADPEAGLTLIHDAAGTAVRQPLAGTGSPIGLPEAIAFSSDGNRIFVASAAARNVSAFDAASGASTTLACDCTPASLVRMGTVFRLNEFSAGPLWLLDATAADPRLVFVPAMKP